MKRWPYILSMVVLIFFSGVTECWADTLQIVRQMPITARLMTADNLGNIYLVRKDNELLRLNTKGDSTGYYKGIYNGAIESIDATNPLNILLYYPQINKAVVLDRMLAPKWEVDFSTQNIYAAPAVCMSIDGNIWVYDKFSARLKKVDEQLNEKVDATDLRALLFKSPSGSYMIEQDRRVYLVDEQMGVFIFDQWANYVTQLPFENVRQLQASGSQLYYVTGQTFHLYDTKGFKKQTIDIPDYNGHSALNLHLTPEHIIVLYSDALVWFSY